MGGREGERREGGREREREGRREVGKGKRSTGRTIAVVNTYLKRLLTSSMICFSLKYASDGGSFNSNNNRSIL